MRTSSDVSSPFRESSSRDNSGLTDGRSRSQFRKGNEKKRSIAGIVARHTLLRQLSIIHRRVTLLSCASGLVRKLLSAEFTDTHVRITGTHARARARANRSRSKRGKQEGGFPRGVTDDVAAKSYARTNNRRIRRYAMFAVYVSNSGKLPVSSPFHFYGREERREAAAAPHRKLAATISDTDLAAIYYWDNPRRI